MSAGVGRAARGVEVRRGWWVTRAGAGRRAGRRACPGRLVAPPCTGWLVAGVGALG